MKYWFYYLTSSQILILILDLFRVFQLTVIFFMVTIQDVPKTEGHRFESKSFLIKNRLCSISF